MQTAEKYSIGGGFRAGLLLSTVVVFIVGSIWTWIFINRSVETQRNEEFLKIVDMTEEEITDSLNGVVGRLYDLRGFVNSGDINSRKWNEYMLSSGIADMTGEGNTFAYASIVQRSNLEKYQREVRESETEGTYKTFSVFPSSSNTELVPVRFLYTTDPDLEMLLGYDLNTSENNAAAIKMAVMNNTPTMTNLLHLGLVIPGNTKVGYVIMLPVYRSVETRSVTIEDKDRVLSGLVGVWIFPGSLLSEAEKEKYWENKKVKMVVYDGDDLLYSLGEGEKEPLGMEVTREIVILNKKFKFNFIATSTTILQPFTESLPLLTALGLIIANLMWLTTVVSILSSRQEAVRMADEATKDLRKFKQAVEGVSDQVLITNAEGEIIYANKATEKETGYKREELMGKKMEFYDQDTKNEYYKKMYKTVKEERKPFWGEVLNKRKNGVMYEAEVSLYPIEDEKKRLIYIVAIERDLSKLKAMDRMKTEFIALASHQLRTPLSAVKWFGKMLISEEAGKLNEVQKDYVKKINESNDREISLVNSLLNVSRIESGKIVLTPRRTDLIDLVETTVIDSKKEAEKEQKTVTVIIDKKIPEMMIDDDLIRHVYQNLISNAVRYTKRGGKILVKVYIDKNRVVSEVKDNGIGIPAGEKSRIFEKFFRASNAMKKETDGNGLGLYLSKTIVESSGGKIGFRSTEGRGSTFWFTLPIPAKRRGAVK